MLRWMTSIFVFAALASSWACGVREASATLSPAPQAAAEEAEPDDGYHGAPAPETKPLPSFSAVADTTGAAVKPESLRGSPTVLWFYPAAATPG